VGDASGVEQGGPSPRTWGEQRANSVSGIGIRTIPTHVGRTYPFGGGGDCCSDHPHARGENDCEPALELHEAGPSPRTWGERNPEPRKSALDRTIPTHVGRTPLVNFRPRPITDHPHARGENSNLGQDEVDEAGPSPRTWGELVLSFLCHLSFRTIPTHVGRTAEVAAGPGRLTDHPHARGENAAAADPRHGPVGPSPRTWGELQHVLSRPLQVRTIPTHVGRTKPCSSPAVPPPDHPHARGENESSIIFLATSCGPSPRTWGERR